MGNSIVFEIRGGAGRRLARMKSGMEWLQRLKELWRPGQRPRLALALAGGGVIGGMYEVGAITALEERLSGHGRFDIYVGDRKSTRLNSSHSQISYAVFCLKKKKKKHKSERN